jgi:hypothetical protein
VGLNQWIANRFDKKFCPSMATTSILWVGSIGVDPSPSASGVIGWRLRRAQKNFAAAVAVHSRVAVEGNLCTLGE